MSKYTKSKKYPNVYTDEKGRIFYRIKVKTSEGKIFDSRVFKDKDGIPFQTQYSAHLAKLEHEKLLKAPVVEEPCRMTVKEVYNNYLKTAAGSIATSTLRKQESIWVNHVRDRFGDRIIDTISVGEINTFLDELYNKYSYKYVEGFLKFFYLLFGNALAFDAISSEKYSKMCEIRGKRITMPKIRQSDYEELEKGPTTYDETQLCKMETLFDSEDGNLLCAFYLGLYCGLRISECFALRWRDIDFESCTLQINRQMHYENGKIELSGVKTLTSIRTIVIPSTLYEYLCFIRDKQESEKQQLGRSYKNTEQVYDSVTGKWLEEEERDFVNRKSDGKILTVSSMKYWSKRIKDELGIDFKYHNLRHTYATNCALNNVNMYVLMSMMGHKKFETTKEYYLNTDNDIFKKKTKEILDQMCKSNNSWKFS